MRRLVATTDLVSDALGSRACQDAIELDFEAIILTVKGKWWKSVMVLDKSFNMRTNWLSKTFT
jgi:hypothetical protein